MHFKKKMSLLFKGLQRTERDQPYGVEESENTRAPITRQLRPQSKHFSNHCRRTPSPPLGHLSTERSHDTLNLSWQSRSFVTSITATSLSHFLIWYIYYDIVPSDEIEGFWYHQLARDILIGWIRLGHELSTAATENRSSVIPPALEDAILELQLDPKEICQRLIRLSNYQAMMQHELADFDRTTSAGWHATAEKLLRDKYILSQARAVPASSGEERQAIARDCIDNFMSWVVRPTIEPSRIARIASGEESEAHYHHRMLAQRSFALICSSHRDPPLELVHIQACEQVMSADRLLGLSTNPENPRCAAYTDLSMTGDTIRSSSTGRQLRRQSAPLLGQNEQLMLSLQESVDAMREEINLLRAGRQVDDHREENGPVIGSRERWSSSNANEHLGPRSSRPFMDDSAENKPHRRGAMPPSSLATRDQAQLSLNGSAARSTPSLVLQTGKSSAIPHKSRASDGKGKDFFPN